MNAFSESTFQHCFPQQPESGTIIRELGHPVLLTMILFVQVLGVCILLRRQPIIPEPPSQEDENKWKEEFLQSCKNGDCIALGKMDLTKLADGTVVNSLVDSDGLGPLHLACAGGHLKAVEFLVKKCGSNVNARSRENDDRPLHFAASNNYLAVVECLVKNEDTELHLVNKNCETPLHSACRNGHVEVARILVEQTRQGFPNCVEAETKDFRRPLHWACKHGHLAVVKYLVSECDANLHAVDTGGNTPLHYASANNGVDVVQYLVEKLPNTIDLPNKAKAKETPVGLARFRGHKKVAKLLREGAPSKDCVFINFTGQDAIAGSFAQHLHHALRNAHIDSFYDAESMPPGARNENVLRENAGSCRIFVAILSKKYFERYWCLEELRLAMKHHRRIIPVYLGIPDGKSLPTDYASFCRPFEKCKKNQKRVTEKEVQAWWRCIKELRKLQDERDPNPHERGHVSLEKQVVEKIKGLLWRPHELALSPGTARSPVCHKTFP